MWFVLAWWLAVVTVPGLVIVAGSVICDRVNLTVRGVNVVWSGAFVVIAVACGVAILTAPRYGL